VKPDESASHGRRLLAVMVERWLVRWPVSEITERLGEVEDAKTPAGLLLHLHGQPRQRLPE
jgi:hypothetical protein